MKYAYFEGNFVPLDEARIPITNPAFLYGLSLFEGIRGYWLPETRQVSIFQLKAHYQRLLANSKLFFLTPEHSLEALCDITTELVSRNAHPGNVYIRPTLFKSGDNIVPSLLHTTTDFCVWLKPLGDYLDLNKGLSVCVSTWRRVRDNAISARAKAGGAYMNTALAATDARMMGFDDAIFLTEAGTLSEGSAMNIFLVKNGRLITPSKTEDILEGITRETIITLARNELGIETEERVIDRTELYHADEAFFCGTGVELAPITEIDRRSVGTGQIGPITRQIQNLYFETVKNQHPQYSDWCTLVNL